MIPVFFLHGAVKSKKRKAGLQPVVQSAQSNHRKLLQVRSGYYMQNNKNKYDGEINN